jgi:3-methyladenine DNA glycosylase AlkD
MDIWVKDFDNWDICDQCCINLFVDSQFRDNKIFKWAASDKEFIKRTAFSLIAVSGVHLKNESNEHFRRYFVLIEKTLTDNRNFVKKAVNWALRQIGKRNIVLNAEAITFCKRFENHESAAARWIVRDALRELTDKKIKRRFE